MIGFRLQSIAVMVAATSVLLSFLAERAEAAHSAVGIESHDGLYNGFAGTPTPPSNELLNIVGGTPAYLNAIIGAPYAGTVATNSLGSGATYLVGLAIHIADDTGPSHSLSLLNDPALNDILFDLHHSVFAGDFTVTAYAYGNAPSQYSQMEAVLSAGEAANGGQPFDLLFVGTDTAFQFKPAKLWSFGFSSEIGNLDGITALSVTDIGIVPEPTGVAMLGMLAAPALLARRRRW